VQFDVFSKQPDQAIARVKQQLDREPQNGGFLNLLGQLLFSSHDYAGARDAGQKAMQVSATDEDAVLLYGRAQVELGDKDAAIAAWQHWIDSHPTDASAVTMIAEIEDKKGDEAKAMDFYKKALQLQPGQPLASNNLAYLMLQNGGNLDVALSLAQQARQGLPDNPSTADTLAWVYYSKGQYASARDLLEDAIKIAPGNQAVQYHLGMTYRKLGDKTNAMLHLKKAASLAPDTPIGKSAATALSQPG